MYLPIKTTQNATLVTPDVIITVFKWRRAGFLLRVHWEKIRTVFIGSFFLEGVLHIIRRFLGVPFRRFGVRCCVPNPDCLGRVVWLERGSTAVEGEMKPEMRRGFGALHRLCI
ncbi:hypothetical protein NDU88_007584 [Pleurodeles waltl]|uniref:Uncharacterized protein n=1 Tax=Pleurodeles waltl TaxID=8319 RepID=A0AAV7P190_PLEWA|nr:hypothetical protein NDU88_007584 [Pleurodeles waltl]